MIDAGTIDVTLPNNAATAYNPSGQEIQPSSAPSGLNAGAWQAATIAGSSLGIEPAVLYAQFKGETGNFTNSGASVYNYGSIMPGGKLATYQSPQNFAQAFTGLIRKDYPNAVGSGSNIKQYVQGLTDGRIGTYYANPPGMAAETSDMYANMIASNIPEAANIPKAKPLSFWDKAGIFGSALLDNAGNMIAHPIDQTTKTINIVKDSVKPSILNGGLIIFGGLLIAGALFLGYKNTPNIQKVFK